MPRVRPLGPNPMERPNWDTMNEGQRRYAMEQWNLARVRRGELFVNPEEQEAIDDFDLNLFSPVPGSPEEAVEENENVESEAEEEDGVDDFLNQIRDNQENRMSSNSQMSTSSGVQSGSLPTPGQRPVSRTSTLKGKSSKRPRVESSQGSSLPGTSGNLDGMDVNSVDGNNAAVLSFRELGFNRHHGTYTFKKQWKFLSFGVAPIILNDAISETQERWAMTSSLVNIPWEYAFMYMSPAEYETFNNRYPGAHAVHCKISIGEWNPRVAFNTGETLSQTATLNQNKFLLIGDNLRGIDYIEANNRIYQFSATEPMQPTALNDDIISNHEQYRNDITRHLYGVTNDITEFPIYVPAAACGQEVTLDEYFTMYCPKYDNTTKLGWAPLNNHIQEFNAMEFVGKSFYTKEHTFGYAPLNAKWPQAPKSGIRKTQQATIHQHNLLNRHMHTADNQIITGTVANQPTQTNSVWTNISGKGAIAPFISALEYNRLPLEQSGNYMEMNDTNRGVKNMESIHIGVRAVPKLTTVDGALTANAWLDTQAYWLIDCELTVAYDNPYTNILNLPFERPSQVEAVTTNAGNPVLTSYDPPPSYGKPVSVLYSMLTDQVELLP